MLTTGKLIKPDSSYLEEIQHFRFDLLVAGSSMDGTGPLKRMPDSEEWLAFSRKMEDQQYVPESFVTAEQFIYVRPSDDKILGMIQLRHELTDALKRLGGHIGYTIRPDERQKGYAKQMLAACLEVCAYQKMKKVLITCREDNEASRRTILVNGGQYADTIYHEQEAARIERYWVHLS